MTKSRTADDKKKTSPFFILLHYPRSTLALPPVITISSYPACLCQLVSNWGVQYFLQAKELCSSTCIFCSNVSIVWVWNLADQFIRLPVHIEQSNGFIIGKSFQKYLIFVFINFYLYLNCWS